MVSAEAIMRGAIDLHAHGFPEFSASVRPSLTNLEWARHARDAGMRGFVVKSHMFPTIGVADVLGELFPELAVFGSITLNPPAGGINPMVVEAAIESGARVVWMPTWSARQTGATHGFFLREMSARVQRVDPAYWPDRGLTVLDDEGRLTPEAEDVIALCVERDTPLASGHLPIEASLPLCRKTTAAGGTFVLTHPLGASVGASLEQQVEVAAMGGYVEHAFVACMPMHQRLDPRLIVESIEAVGAERTILVSDAIGEWNPPAPELLRSFIATMLGLGVADEDLVQMTHVNPAAVLGLEAV